MARLPQPGSDEGTWGQVLNDYLSQTHDATGALKANIVSTTQIAPGAVSSAELGDGTVTEAKLSSAVQTKLNTSGGGAVTSVVGKTGVVTLVKADVGLSNVDNTNDATKPISSATQTALNQKAATIHAHTSADITDATAAGKALLTAADAHAQTVALNVYSKSDTRIYSANITAATATPSGNSLTNLYFLTALTSTVSVSAPSGTASDGNALILRLKDNGISRAITWNIIYRPVGVTLPATTLSGKTLYVAALYNLADSKWDVVDVRQEA